MKIEFKKDTKLDGDVFYYTEVDGAFVKASLKMNYDEAYKIYNRVKENGGMLNITEVLESFDTEQTPY